MESLEEIKTRIEQAVPNASIAIVPNPGPSGQASILVDPGSAVAVAEFLKTEPTLLLDYCSNATGVDWLDKTISTKKKVAKLVDGTEQEVEETVQETIPGYLEAVFHLYSTKLRHGPLVFRMRTAGREAGTRLPSLTPVYISAELQEREIYDLYGIHFDGHPDLRRILMWDGFVDHPMRKDYLEPDDFEYEPTPHDEVLARVKEHQRR